MLFVAISTAPFVNYVHLKLPTFARQSREQLMKWSRDIPPSTEVDMTTMRLFGLPRVTRMRLSDLNVVRGSTVGVANLVKTPRDPAKYGKRPWWRGPELRKFYVANKMSKSNQPTILQMVLDSIQKRQNQPPPKWR